MGRLELDRIAAMKSLLLVFAFVCTATALSTDQEFELFKINHGKTYKHKLEHHVRRAIFHDNYNYIEKHNAEAAEGKHTYTLRVNQFADMTHEEFMAERVSPVRRSHHGKDTKNIVEVDTSSLPSSVDWTLEGYVTGVKDQKQCGSCWTFSATGCMEGAHFKSTNNLVSLSEQNLLDCVHPATDGCQGGQMDDAFEYAIDNGIMSEADYSYHAVDMTCDFDSNNVAATFTSYEDVAFYSESALQQAVADVGPVSVGIDASLTSFQFYFSGVYAPSGCSSLSLDHGVLAVGYGTSNGQDYWLVKNSWGTSWGQSGYIWMARNDGNKCGIATDASYIVA